MTQTNQHQECIGKGCWRDQGEIIECDGKLRRWMNRTGREEERTEWWVRQMRYVV
jgi:hypothetical protein